jgi:hypothetical protein
MDSVLAWLGTGLFVLLSLIVLTLGVTQVRSRRARAGYMIGAAASLRVLMACGIHGGQRALEALDASIESFRMATIAISVVSTVEHLIFWGLLAGAAVSVVRANAAGESEAARG